MQVLVEMHGRPPLQVDLPFGVDARQGRAHRVDAEQRLILELPYKSYRSFTQVCLLLYMTAASSFALPGLVADKKIPPG